MSEAPVVRKRRFRLWLTISELVGVLALLIAALNFWDTHRERVHDARREAAADHAASARYALVMSSQMQAEGARLDLRPVDPSQAIQSERYLFPRAILDHAMGVSAATPQIDLDWIAAGLQTEVARMRQSGSGANGEGSVSFGVIAIYVQNGEMRTDQSVYRLGYAWRSRLLGGPRLALQGVSLVRRGVPGDLRTAVEIAWRQRGDS